MTFPFRRRRFHFRAADAIAFPGPAANVLRGGFGTVLRAADPAAFARLFAPRGTGVPSGFADPPRPFLFRAAHLDGCRIAPGGTFHCDVHLFDLRDSTSACVSGALEELARLGLGPGRGRAALDSVEDLPAPAIDLDLPEPASALRIRFLTATELKIGAALAPEPAFPVLFSRLRDRLSTLRALYGPGPLAIDFRALAARAAAVRMTRCALEHVRAARHSSRTGQTHPLGGFVGEADYEGALAEFVPYLRAGQWTGVGRQTVWGKGALEVVILR